MSVDKPTPLNKKVLTLDLDNVPNEDDHIVDADKKVSGFIATHKSILLHNTHVRRLLYKVAGGQLNCVMVGEGGFAVKMEWSRQYLQIIPGIVNVTMPDSTLYISHATFWRKEEERKKLLQKTVAQKKVEDVDEATKKLLQQQRDEEVY